jgi:hypothetical protein
MKNDGNGKNHSDKMIREDFMACVKQTRQKTKQIKNDFYRLSLKSKEILKNFTTIKL